MNGTNETSNLNKSDICDIIKLCKRCGVSSFRLADIHIMFFEPQFIFGPNAKPIPVTKESIKKASEIEEESIAKEEYQTREDQLAQMLIEDPVGYEELIATNEITESSPSL